MPGNESVMISPEGRRHVILVARAFLVFRGRGKGGLSTFVFRGGGWGYVLLFNKISKISVYL